MISRIIYDNLRCYKLVDYIISKAKEARNTHQLHKANKFQLDTFSYFF